MIALKIEGTDLNRLIKVLKGHTKANRDLRAVYLLKYLETLRNDNMWQFGLQHPSIGEGYDDVHSRKAAQIFQVPLEEVTKEQREVAKVINYGVAYGENHGVTMDGTDGIMREMLTPTKAASKKLAELGVDLENINRQDLIDELDELIQKSKELKLKLLKEIIEGYDNEEERKEEKEKVSSTEFGQSSGEESKEGEESWSDKETGNEVYGKIRGKSWEEIGNEADRKVSDEDKATKLVALSRWLITHNLSLTDAFEAIKHWRQARGRTVRIEPATVTGEDAHGHAGRHHHPKHPWDRGDHDRGGKHQQEGT